MRHPPRRRSTVAAPTVEALERRRMLASGPIVITRGGTYSGEWENLIDRTPVVTIRTTDPVVIENARIRGKGHLIHSATPGAKITVRNTSGYGVNPNVFGESTGRFLTVERPGSVTVQDNYLEGTAGIHVLGYGGDHAAAQTIRVIGNRARNIDGRRSDGNGGYIDFNERTHLLTGREDRGYDYAQFLQLDKVLFVPGIQIAWNEVTNEVGKSRVEDNINIYKSAGTRKSPIRIHDNYIEGAFTLRPWQDDYVNGNWRYDWGYSGGGILIGDGFGANIDADAGYVRAYGNTVVGTTNFGIAAAAGHDSEIYLNRILSSGTTPDGGASLRQNVGIYVWDSYKVGPARFFNNVARDNLVGWVKHNRSRNDWWSPHEGTLINNTRWAGSITRQTELNEAAAWRSRRYPPSLTPATGLIAGTIFNDRDADGVRDAGEEGLTGVRIYLDIDRDGLLDAGEPVSRSSSTGRYHFASLQPGKYLVRAVAGEGWSMTTPSAASLAVSSGMTATRYFGLRWT